MIGIVGGIRRARARREERAAEIEAEPEPEENTCAEEEEDDAESLGPINRFRLHLWNTFEDQSYSTVAKVVSWSIMATITVSVASFLVGSWPVGGCIWEKPNYIRICPDAHGLRLGDEQSLKYIEMVCVIIFSFEFVVRALTCGIAVGYFKFWTDVMNLIDLLAIIPWYLDIVLDALNTEGDASFLGVLRVVRLVRVLRVFKMSRSFSGMLVLMRTVNRSMPAIFILFTLIIMFGLVFGTLIYLFEGGDFIPVEGFPGEGQYLRSDGNESPFTSIPVAIYWCMVTMSTVGYGDMYPINPVGYVVGSITIIGGLMVLSLPITIISANFDDEAREHQRATVMEKRLKRREARARGIPIEEPKTGIKSLTGRFSSSSKSKPAGGDVDSLKAAPAAAPTHEERANSDLAELTETISDFNANVMHEMRAITNKHAKELTEHTVKVILTSRVLSKKNLKNVPIKPPTSAMAASSDAGETHVPREGGAIRPEVST